MDLIPSPAFARAAVGARRLIEKLRPKGNEPGRGWVDTGGGGHCTHAKWVLGLASLLDEQRAGHLAAVRRVLIRFDNDAWHSYSASTACNDSTQHSTDMIRLAFK